MTFDLTAIKKVMAEDIKLIETYLEKGESVKQQKTYDILLNKISSDTMLTKAELALIDDIMKDVEI